MLAARLAMPLLMVAILLHAAGAARADQSDERLEPLFEVLRTTQAPEEAVAAEAEIWRIWLQSGEDEVDKLMVLGIVAMEQSRYDDAIGFFDEITVRAPGFAEGWNKRATAYFLKGDYPASVRDIQRTLALEPRHFGALSGMGQIFLRREDLAGALAAFEAVLEIHPHARTIPEIVEALRSAMSEPAA